MGRPGGMGEWEYEVSYCVESVVWDGIGRNGVVWFLWKRAGYRGMLGGA